MANRISRLISALLLASTLCVTPAFAGNNGIVKIDQAAVRAQGGFPFKITEPGSYKLTSNLVVPAKTNGIELHANNVTIDLNGFTISGPFVCNGDGLNCQNTPIHSPIGVVARATKVTVRNGYIQGFAIGIQIFGGLLENVQVSDNLAAGISGEQAVLKHNSAHGNAGIGIQCFGCMVTENEAADNVGFGFSLGGGGVFGSNVLFSGLGQRVDLGETVTTQHNSSCDENVC